MKPLQAVASTGAAVATLGLAVLAKGIYDRITAEENLCTSVLAKAEGVVPGQSTSREEREEEFLRAVWTAP